MKNTRKAKKSFIKFLITILILAGIIGGGYFAYTQRANFLPSYQIKYEVEGEIVEEYTTTAVMFDWLNLPTPQEKEGYDFVGWYNGDKLWKSYSLVQGDMILQAKYEPKLYEITYIFDGQSHKQYEKYDSMPQYNGEVTQTPTEYEQYTFSHWEPSLSIIKGNATYTAHFTSGDRYFNVQITKNIASAGTTTLSSNYLHHTAVNIIATVNDGYEFLGWYENDVKLSNSMSYQLTSSITKDYNLVAKYKALTKTVNYIVDGTELSNDAVVLNINERLSEPVINTSDYGMSGYEIVGWYTDSACTHSFNFNSDFDSNLTLYGKWEYKYNQGFYPYLSKFTQANAMTVMNIDSFEELVAWVDYIQFYNITSHYNIKLTYKELYGDSITDEFRKTENYTIYPSNARNGYNYSSFGHSTGSIYVYDSGYRNSEATLVADQAKNYTYPQIDYALKQTNASPRTQDTFNIDKVQKTLQVSTSNQLVYALEIGVKPVCVAGSKAEQMYNKAKTILKNICNDNMSEYEKLKAIYEWLILNVNYDNYAANNSFIQSQDNWHKYDSWYLEGVFNNKTAVCDGIAKALLVMTQIENIPTIRVSGDGHAWNRVNLNNIWYGIDATHGNVALNSTYEMLTYVSFLFTDEYKSNHGNGYTSNKRTEAEYAATTTFNVYEYETYTYEYYEFFIKKTKQVDMYIENETQLNDYISYVKAKLDSGSGSNTSFEIAISSSYTITREELITALQLKSINLTYIPVDYDSLGNTVYTVIIIA